MFSYASFTGWPDLAGSQGAIMVFVWNCVFTGSNLQQGGGRRKS
jgi:hypothetical protein